MSFDDISGYENPYLRELQPNPNIDNHLIYSASRGALESIGVEIDDANEEKMIVKGYYLGNKREVFKVHWKKTSEGGFKIKIEPGIKLREDIFKRRDLRDLSEDKYKEIIIVKFWDSFYRDLGLGLAPGFGEKKLATTEKSKKEKLREYFENEVKILFENESKINKFSKGINYNFNEVILKNKNILDIINKKSQFPKETLYGIEIYLDDEHSIEKTVVMTINTLDMKTVTILPVEINIILILPRALPRQLDMGYKCKWTTPPEESDDESIKIIHKLNFENSPLEKELLQFYSQEYLYHFVFTENFEDKGKMTKITHDQMLLYPINLQRIQHPVTNMETFVLVLRYFLRITKRNTYEGFKPISDSLNLMNRIFNELKPYFIKTEEDIKKEKEKQEKLESQEKKIINKCVRCGWLLSDKIETCPMCGSPVPKEKKLTLSVDSTFYDKSSALLDAQQKVYSEKLIKDFDKLLENWGDPKLKLINSVKETFDFLLDKEKSKAKILEIIKDEDYIEIEIGDVKNFYKKLYSDDMEVIGEYLVKLKDYDISWVHIGIQLLDLHMEDIFPILISYTIIGPYISRAFSFIRQEDKKRKENEILIWQNDEGEDSKLVISLNSKASDFNEIIQRAYKNESTYRYIEPLIDDKGKSKGIKLSLDLYPIIRVEPYISRKLGPKSIICMRQFLDFKQSGYIPLSIIFALLETLYSIIDIFKEEYKENKKEEVIIDYGLLDKKIEQSKYTYQKKLKTEAEKVYEDLKTETTNIPKVEFTEGELSTKLISTQQQGFQTQIEEKNIISLIDKTKSIKQTNTVENKEQLIDHRSKTYFINELPANFYIDPYMTDEELNKRINILNNELNSLYILAETEIKALEMKKQTFEMCMNQLNNFLIQIKQKQAMIRAYEYEKFRVKLERTQAKELKKEFAGLL